MSKLLKLIVGLGIVLILIASYTLMQPALPQVEVAKVSERPFVVTVEDQGRTRARNPYIVAAPLAGRLLRTELNEGDRVSKGQIVARISLSPPDRRTVAIESANLSAAEASLNAEQALLVEAQGVQARANQELKRREELLNKKLISLEEVEQFRQAQIAADSRVTSSAAAVIAARANVENVNSRLLGSSKDLTSGTSEVENVLAPSDGTVLRVVEESERVVLAGTPLLEISNQDEIEVVVDLLTQDAVRVEAGDKVSIDGWGGDFTLEGVVLYIEPEAFTKFSALGIEEQRVNVIIDLLNPPENLGAEYRVEVRISVLEFSNALTIPANTLFQRSGSWNVFVVEDSHVVLRQVEIGNRNRNFARVISGVREGDLVVQYPTDLIEDGIEVRLN